MAYAEHQFKIGPTLKDLLHVEQVTGKTPKELLNQPEIPFELRHVWGWFLTLHPRRSQTSLTFQDISAWASLTGVQLAPFELDALIRVDDAYVAEQLRKVK